MEKEFTQSAHANINRQKQSNDEPLSKGINYCPSLSSPAVSNQTTILSSSKIVSVINSTKLGPKSYAQIAALNATQSISNNSWTENIGNNHNRKSNTASSPKVDPEKRRLIF